MFKRIDHHGLCPAGRVTAGRTLLWGIGGTVAAVAMRLLLSPVLGHEYAYMPVLPIVVLVALAAGWIAGTLCLVLSSILLLFLIGHSPMERMGADDWLALLLMLAVGGLVIAVSESYRRLRIASEQAAFEARAAADSLRESEERFRRLAELSPDAILVLAEGRCVFANAATMRLLGASDEGQVIGHSPFEMVHPDSRKDVEARLGRLIATGQANPPAEHRFFRLDGSVITIEASSTLVPWTSGVAVQVIARDVTQRKRADQELRESRAALEDFFENSPVPIHWIGTDGRILRANRAELDMLGYAAEEFIGQKVRDFFEVPELADELLARLFAGETLHHVDVRLRTRSGKIRQILMDSNVQTQHGDMHTRCFLVDVTEQREAERAIQAALDRFRLCARATNDIIYDWDLQKNRLEWNDAMRAVAGDENDEEITRIDWWKSQLHPDDRSEVERTMYEALEGSAQHWTAEYRFRKRDGSYISLFDRAFIVRNERGKAVRLVGAMIDFTERRRFEDELAWRAQELERSNGDLRDFANIISHDLKAPLRGISDYAGYLLDGYTARLDQDGADMLHTLTRLCRRMHELLDSLMEYAHVGRATLRTTRADLNDVLGRVVDALGTRLEAEQVQLILARPLPTAECDSILIEQVFTNLIVNAIKYNPGENKRVEIGARYRDEEAPIIYVRDNGMGIEEQHLEVIFQMFRRLHPGDSFGGGTGSGLSIVKKIVERHGGRVWVESKVGEGSTFFFTLGERTADDTPPTIETSSSSKAPRDDAGCDAPDQKPDQKQL